MVREGAGRTGTDPDGGGRESTRSWVEGQLSEGEYLERAVRLRDGWTSQMRRPDLRGPDGPRSLVLRCFVKPFFVRHARGLLTREAAVLRLLGGSGVPAATLVAVDATAQHCDHPSLLMTLLPGAVRLGDQAVGGTLAEDPAEHLYRRLLDALGSPPTPRRWPCPGGSWAGPTWPPGLCPGGSRGTSGPCSTATPERGGLSPPWRPPGREPGGPPAACGGRGRGPRRPASPGRPPWRPGPVPGRPGRRPAPGGWRRGA